ncbi:MAG: pinensin family lanthipeptide [Bacteroidota bacterium]
MKKAKLKLDDLKVTSFVTSEDELNMNTIKGGLQVSQISDGDVHCPTAVHRTCVGQNSCSPSFGFICKLLTV